MTDDKELADLDPYDLMATEGARLDRFFATAAAADWEKPTRCEGWTTRDLLAHLAASEDYNQACLDGHVQQFLADMGAKGVVDLASANELGIREFDDRTPEEILDIWRTRERARIARRSAHATAATSTAVSARTRRAGRRSTSRSSSRPMPTTSVSRSPRPRPRLATSGRRDSAASRSAS